VLGNKLTQINSIVFHTHHTWSAGIHFVDSFSNNTQSSPVTKSSITENGIFVIVNCPRSPTITHCCDFQSFVTDEQCCKPYRPFKLLVFKIAKMILIVFMKNPQKIPNFSSEHENDINKIFVFYVTLKYSDSALSNRI
jgi:hypothetical protein